MKLLESMAVAALFFAGCSAPKPELLSIEPRDKVSYEDPAGPLSQKKHDKIMLAVTVSPGEIPDGYRFLDKSLESKMSDALSKFAFFSLVERSNIKVVGNEVAVSGHDGADLVVPADCLINAALLQSVEF